MARKRIGVADQVAGKLKRAVGEIIGRPDLVIEGEAQDTGCAPESDLTSEKSGAPRDSHASPRPRGEA